MRDRHENLRAFRNAFSMLLTTSLVRQFADWRLKTTHVAWNEFWSVISFRFYGSYWCLVCSWIFAVLQIDKVVIDVVPNDVLKTWMGDRFSNVFAWWINVDGLTFAHITFEPKNRSYLTVLICGQNPVFADVIRKTNYPPTRQLTAVAFRIWILFALLVSSNAGTFACVLYSTCEGKLC